MNKLSLALLLFAASNLVVSAQTAAELKIKKLSEFDAHTVSRDPFWPVGWQKAALAAPSGAASAAAAAALAATTLKPESFVVTSISTGTLPLALINGKTYGEGELIPVDIGGRRITVQVYAIRDGTVTLRYQNQTITARIRER